MVRMACYNFQINRSIYIFFFICYGTISSIYREMMFFKVGFLFSSSELVIILYCSKMFYIVSTILWCPHFPHRLQCEINKEVSFIEHG